MDEFDRIVDNQTKAQMADLIKNISDNLRGITLVVVGVGSNIAEIIGNHPSVNRNLVQIEMPIMAQEDIQGILSKGFKILKISVERDVLDEVVKLANGFPHYAHLLGLSIAKASEIRDVKKVTHKIFRELVCNIAIEDAIETYRNVFMKAVRTSKPSRYPLILCACGSAACDEQGVFRATDVVDAMASLFNISLNVQAVVPALGEFCDEDRGPVLIKVPVGDRSHYRFFEPMMRPFLALKAKTLG